MPKGYVIFSEVVKDNDAMNAYVMKAGGTIGAYGGSALVVADGPECIEGTWTDERIVLLEFPSVEKAKEWYNSPEYQAVVGERLAAADCNTVIVPGFG